MTNELELLYAAFAEYRKLTASRAESGRNRRAISASGADDDRIESIRSICKIDEAWVNAIESGLVYVEKAVREERQFIRAEGEVVPIEKAKRVSKASVAHLAKHSNMINREYEGKGIMPEKLFIVEKLSDYAVYENRFLYMLLCYLRDFINLRLEKISELGNTYNGKMHLKKDVVIGKRRLKFETRFSEISRKDPYSFFDKSSSPIIGRIESAQHIVMSLLNTPLMEQVSKSPMIKPPITKTNVLKMNTNFKAAVALYEYVSAYMGAGYTIEEVRKTLNPLPENVADEAAELVTLTSFLTYVYGNGLSSELKRRYAAAERKKEEEEKREFLDKIKSLKRRVAETGQGIEEYALALERRVRELESFGDKMTAMKKELDSANDHIGDLNAAIDSAAERERTLKGDISAITDNVHSLEGDIDRMASEHESALAAEKDRLAEEKREADKERDALIAEARAACQAENLKYAEAAEKSEKEKTLISAQLNGLRKQHGLITPSDDYTSKERFAELEKQYIAFASLFDDQWKGAKKRIRKDILWTKNKPNK